VVAVGFVVHPDRFEAGLIADRARDWLSSRGHKAEQMVSDVEHSDVDDESPVVRTPSSAHIAIDPSSIDLAVSLGGDGTMLRTIAMCVPFGVPVLGVNLGRLGYLTEVEPTGLENALERFLLGDYQIEERMTLDVSVDRVGQTEATGRGAQEEAEQDRNKQAGPYLVLNEAVVERTIGGHTIRIAAQIDGKPFVTYASDGLLVSTPTGSTAYNLSVRGPILSPQMQAIVLTPVSPHMLFDRPLVLGADQWVRLELAPPRPALLVLDGSCEADLEPGDAVICRSGRYPARLVTFGRRDFHAILRARFHLADR
jgi:NAD+ kinase